ncbi:phosphate ABC transporter permease [Aliarcobacter trophiarum LMG 25534]|uniref:Phosphate ABC transporter permease n=1 Tax=Aliarcobacter trophiarum LMG 25534 TaxID=1032241 RepID=A0AAD0QIQ4_9BACT|nr:ABC transporter permease subunit [Aliarcobacter trophiarum]AXK48431.1 phosphate ABC transporter, permease protein [Aliarcobacter trophiarum LMG 25534]RXJ88688.1 phosphate ABC transporter permease [Aliarcobacter trophiarum LMG 25534]
MYYLFNFGLVISIFITSSLVLFILFFLIYFSFPLLTSGNFLQFFAFEWIEQKSLYGLMPMILGTIYISILATLIATIMSFSFASLMAFFIPKNISNILNKFMLFISGVPTVLYAFIAIFLLVPWLNDILDGQGFSILTASFVLSFVVLPTMTIILFNTFNSTSKKTILAAKSLGATNEDIFFDLILKTSKKGIISAIILGFARAVGDTMIALMIAGNSLQIPNSILDSARTLTSHIALINASDYESTAFKAIFLCGLLLLVFSFLTVVSLKLINKEAR